MNEKRSNEHGLSRRGFHAANDGWKHSRGSQEIEAKPENPLSDKFGSKPRQLYATEAL